ncbi:MAG TPA: TlyA family rRNA (cytidine-2'-O)-methyltransferase [Candidatus Saccharimonadales bacterium]|nr:TlyA family rRNA (cytidine-2'-O)-methyltransferase [Candidatus Saccharimonadales bacterium]
MKERLDKVLVDRGITSNRSQAENYIKLGKVKVDKRVVKKPGSKTSKNAVVSLTTTKRYVSRGGFKLESVATKLELDFQNKTVLDVGSSTGGFSDYALQHEAAKIIAVDIGTQQLAEALRTNTKIELHEQTDIKEVKMLSTEINIVLIDVSFTSVRPILKHLLNLIDSNCVIVAMVKPQFEANDSLKHKGVIKNQTIRRKIFKDFEAWVKNEYKILNKADSGIAGEKGNVERFYLLKPLRS